MKHLPFFLISVILLCTFGCGSKNEKNLDKLCQDWIAEYEIATTYSDGEILSRDSSTWCWLFSGSEYLRIFKDSTYIVYDTIWRKGVKYLEPKYKGLFQLNKDTLRFGVTETSILELTDKTLMLQRSFKNGDGTQTVNQTRFKNSHMNYSFDTFNFPKNKIDTATIIETRHIMGLDGKALEFTRFDRAYIYNQDTILHLTKDIPLFHQIDKDSLLNNFNDCFITYNLGDYGDQGGVGGYDFYNIDCVFDKYITYYWENHCYDIIYYGAAHGDWTHRYVTYSFDGTKLLLYDIITPESKVDVNILISDAVLAYKRKSGWLKEEEPDSYYLGKQLLYSRLNYNDRVALGQEGLLVSLEYGDSDTDICFAENYIHAIVPYHELKPYLKYPFYKLAK